MENLNLGQIITTPQQRDAIHVAVLPVIAAYGLAPGEPIGFMPGDASTAVSTKDSERLGGPPTLGIVDPFLREGPQTGQRFWMFLLPGTITSLRHDWTHAAIAASETPARKVDAQASEKWLRDFAESADCPGYFELMGKASAFCDGDTGWSNEYLHFDGSDAHGEIPPEFWTHFEVVTGKRPQGERPAYFSCSC